MNEHERAQALAAGGIDFPLSASDAEGLARHLAGCPACALAVRLLREDATVLTGLERSSAPAQVREAVVRAATGAGTPARASAGARWSFVAALLALIVVGGTFVTGAMLERIRETVPTPTNDLAPRPTERVPASPPLGWTDLGVVADAFDGRTVQLVLPTPDGGLVALGRDQRSTRPVVWTSADGTAWTEATQPEQVFGARVPTGGTLHDGTLWAVGWDIAVTGAQRAVWSSADGATWRRAGGESGLLGTETSGLQVTSGPAGILIWAADGRTWTSSDGARWVRSDAGVEGVTDAAVDTAGFHLVGIDGSRAFLVSSQDGRRWSEPVRHTAGADDRVGIERPVVGSLLAWVGDRAYLVTDGGWAREPGGPDIPPGGVVGGSRDLAVLGSPDAGGAQRAWVGDGQRTWVEHRSERVDRGARTIVSVAPLADGWYVLTRQGDTYRGWTLAGPGPGR